MSAIVVEGLIRDFAVTDREPGLIPALKSVVRRRHRTIRAVEDVTFTVDRGEVVALLGPNGAGKTTTLKCVAGLLSPTAGRVEVLGHEPIRREATYLRRLGFIMGQRWQLHIDLPVEDSFTVLRVMYDIEPERYRRVRDDLVGLLELGDLMTQPFRQLSLGQRMRAEFAASVLHTPEVLLLDEPTLGLDFEAQAQIRSFVLDYVTRHDAAVVLTSHYLADIEAMADRVLTISGGRITFEGPFAELRRRADGGRTLEQVLSELYTYHRPDPAGVDEADGGSKGGVASDGEPSELGIEL